MDWDDLGKHQKHILQNAAFAFPNCPVSPSLTKLIDATASERSQQPSVKGRDQLWFCFLSLWWEFSLQAKLYGAIERGEVFLNSQIFILY